MPKSKNSNIILSRMMMTIQMSKGTTEFKVRDMEVKVTAKFYSKVNPTKTERNRISRDSLLTMSYKKFDLDTGFVLATCYYNNVETTQEEVKLAMIGDLQAKLNGQMIQGLKLRSFLNRGSIGYNTVDA